MGRQYDLILVGGGLANGLIALRLKQLRPELRLLLIEQAASVGGNHTWSFHDADLTEHQLEWVRPLVGCHWDRYSVVFPDRARTLEGGYASIFSDDFAASVTAAMGPDLWLNQTVTELTPTQVRLADGQALQARAVIDGRGPSDSPHLALGYQAFLGQELELQQPHGLSEPILMDASVAQGEGYRFVYLLPFSSTRLLVEDTHYLDGPGVDHARLLQQIQAYVGARGWQVRTMVREEHGVLPLILAGDFTAFWQDAAGQPRSGLRAGLFHPTTGYSLPFAVRLAGRIAGLEQMDAPAVFNATFNEAQQAWARQGFFRLLNRMLFLAGRPDQRWRVLQRFYGLSPGLIKRFYADRLTPADRLRIVTGKPPVPLGQAIRAARLWTPDRIQSHRTHLATLSSTRTRS
ncbi:lycopene beta-cyclase CrtY [Hydrocarboniclastica marina]|uniref:Lycopene cyclase n=1 Tax=Hydrocarboniclastica marina TaxID=2259620 RepID=A0A4V1D960_9ALTE|nr:lycopene beta-cyclase CrtY [Hydrocarboniclastica marina]QCF27560.1 lycopene cyclase [Hydrocarboniclastica marina]